MAREKKSEGPANPSPAVAETKQPDGSRQPEVIPHSPFMEPGHDPEKAKAVPQDAPSTNTGLATPGVIPHAEGMNPGHDPAKAKAVPLDAPGGKPVEEQRVTTNSGRVGTSRVMMNAVRRGPSGETLNPGEYDLDDAEAKEFVRMGLATYIKVEEPKAEQPKEASEASQPVAGGRAPEPPHQ